MGDRLSLLLAGFYVILALIHAYERAWAKVLYWVSATGILMAVRWMKP